MLAYYYRRCGVTMRQDKKRRVLIPLLKPILFAACATAAMAQSFIVFDAPNASATSVANINNSGDVTGYFNDTSKSKQRGFVRNRKGDFTLFDAPNASYTYPAAINDGGDVTGFFYDTSQ